LSIISKTIIGNTTLYLGDCLEVMDSLGAVAAVVTDPSYGIGYVHGGAVRGEKAAVGQTKAANARGIVAIRGDAAPFDPSPFLGFERVLMWGADRYRARLPETGTFIAWDKSVGKGPADSFVDVEFAWCNWIEKRNCFRMLWKGLACDKRGENNGLREHPVQKPVRLMAWCLERMGSVVILDPFMGSGTTGVAAAQLGHAFIGVEIEERWFNIACRRIKEAQRQENLF